MSKEKQVIEIKECIDAVYGADCAYFDVDGFAIAEEIYNAGYRKQEWISVEERLPETDTRVLVYMHENRMSYTKIDTDRIVARKWVRWGDLVTHWMPLPEPPKMKGGSE